MLHEKLVIASGGKGRKQSCGQRTIREGMGCSARDEDDVAGGSRERLAGNRISQVTLDNVELFVRVFVEVRPWATFGPDKQLYRAIAAPDSSVVTMNLNWVPTNQ